MSLSVMTDYCRLTQGIRGVTPKESGLIPGLIPLPVEPFVRSPEKRTLFHVGSRETQTLPLAWIMEEVMFSNLMGSHSRELKGPLCHSGNKGMRLLPKLMVIYIYTTCTGQIQQQG